MAVPVRTVAPPIPPSATVVSMDELRSHCNRCTMRELCLAVGLDREALQELDAIVTNRLRLKKGDKLFRAGDPFAALFAIRLGSCKTTVLTEDGREQVAGYHILGDVVGMDGIGGGRHGCEAVALEDSEFCVLPFEELEAMGRRVAPLQHNLHQFMSREISRSYGVMLQLGSMRAEQRLAAFLINLSRLYRDRGYSQTEFVLRMTREEIGNYLGLKLETVSRLFSRFQQDGLLQVHGRSINLLDIPALKHLVGQTC